MTAAAPPADRTALVRSGDAVRARLSADPAIYRVPTDRAEIFAIGSFLTAEECAHLTAMIDRVAKPSIVYEAETNAQYRTSYSGDVDRDDFFVRMIDRRICDLLGLDDAWGEPAQGQRYLPGQEFHPHYDWFDTAGSYWPLERGRGGQRSWTAMAYLNDVEEGGVTEFVRIGIGIAPQAGALLAWNNMLPDGTPNLDVLHAARPVVRGVKYVVTKWFRTRPWG
jgi:prolyl 4-hydroxylase